MKLTIWIAVLVLLSLSSLAATNVTNVTFVDGAQLDNNVTITNPVTIQSTSITALTLFLIGVILAALGFYIKNDLLILASGVWFIFNGAYNFVSELPIEWGAALFFILIGLSLLWQSVLELGGYR